MRYVLAAVALLGLAGLGWNKAAAQYYCQPRPMPNPCMNYHCPIYIYQSAYWHPCGYGIYGPTDVVGQPVNGMPVPPYCPCLRDKGPAWHRYIRSPRDFFMLEY